jgi:4-amino-4-deoxy-L-arabinose transferase-like glycosyltransferase
MTTTELASQRTDVVDLEDRPPLASNPSPPSRASAWRHPGRSQLITAAIALVAAVLYTWGLSRNGMGNTYYAAAVRAGSKSWKAFFFGSLDPGSFITVDKPPAALWVMELSARLFGFSSWSMLLPEAAAGVGSVLILHRLVRKWAGDVAAHLAALALAVTPVAVLMFRYNNPDAFLTFLCLGAAWAVWSALETGRTRWLLAAGALLGLAFDTKMLQAFLVLPALGLAYLWAGPPRLGRRIAQLLAAGLALVISSGWWVAAVALWPAAARPYIGSTTNNSIISLVFGYNGFARILGGSGRGAPGGGGGGGGAGFGGAAGPWRLFNSALGGQVAWLLPLAGAGLVAGLWLTRRARRSDRGRAGWILWGGWALTCAAVFSLSKGIFHPYYAVQLAPGVAALAGAGAVALWHTGRRPWLSWLLPAVVLATAGVAVGLLARTPTYYSWLRPAISIAAVLAAVGLFAARHLRRRLLVAAAAGLATVALLAGPSAYALSTVGNSTGGAIVAAGPTTGGGLGVGGGRAGVFGPAGTASTDTALIAYLQAHRGSAEYLVAAFSSNSSASIIIATGQPVITIGGFNGGDPAPTLAQFQKLVAQGKVRYVLLNSGFGGGGGPGGASAGGSAITQWVTQHGTQVSYGGSGSLYDVSAAK